MTDFQLWLANQDPADLYHDLLSFLLLRYPNIHKQWDKHQQRAFDELPRPLEMPPQAPPPRHLSQP